MSEDPSKSRRLPNVADPLSEPTINRRLWAAYLHRGFNRNTFAKAMDVNYSTVDDWDTGVRMPHLDNLIAARAVLEIFSMDEFAFGHHAPAQQRLERELGRDAIKALLRDLTADIKDPAAVVDILDAFGTYERSAAGQYTTFTRSYVCAFVDAYRSARDAGDTQRAAIDRAKVVAINARGITEAVALRLNPPPTDAEWKVNTPVVADVAKVTALPRRPATPRRRKKSTRRRA